MTTYDIHERIFNFIISVINILNQIPKTATNLIFINQITRSVTSMGANDQEADGALTNRDFIHCFTIVRKESKEAVFWLRIIGETNDSYSQKIAPLIVEGKEIVAIISTIIKNSAQNPRNK